MTRKRSNTRSRSNNKTGVSKADDTSREKKWRKCMPVLYRLLLRNPIVDIESLGIELENAGLPTSFKTVQKYVKRLGQEKGLKLHVTEGKSYAILEPPITGDFYSNSEKLHVADKIKIAEFIAENEIDSGECVILGPGSTMHKLAVELACRDMENLKVLTPNMKAYITLLAASKTKVYLFGDDLVKDYSCLKVSREDWADEIINDFEPRKVVVAAKRIDGKRLFVGGEAYRYFYDALYRRQKLHEIKLLVVCHHTKLQMEAENDKREWAPIDFKDWPSHCVFVDSIENVGGLKPGKKKGTFFFGDAMVRAVDA